MNKAILTPLIVAFALMMESVDSTVITTAMPLIAGDLGTHPLSLKLAMTTYLLSLAAFIPASGWIADRFGAKKVFLVALAIYVLGSILSGAATSLWQLVAMRALQGIGASMTLPVARMIVVKSVPRAQLVGALVWLTVPAMVGPLLGPPIGGFVGSYLHWRWIFWINVPIGIVGILLTIGFIDDVKEPYPGSFDLTGFAFAATSLVGLVFGFSLLDGQLVSQKVAFALLATGALASCLYLRHWRRSANPVLDLSLFRIDTFRVGVCGGVVFRVCASALLFLLPLLLQIGFGMTPVQSGLVTFFGGVGALLMKFAVTPILRSLGFRFTLLGCSAIVAASFVAIASFTATTAPIVIIGVLLGSGFFRSLQIAALTGLVFCDVEPARAGKATSLYATLFQLANAAGVAMGAAAVDVTSWLGGRSTLGARDFGPAFLLLGVVMLASWAVYWRMPANAADGISGRVLGR